MTTNQHVNVLQKGCLAAICFSLWACESKIEEPDASVTPLTIQVGVSPSTRAAFVDASFSVGSQLGVALIKEPTVQGTSIYNQSSFYTLKNNAPSEQWEVTQGINGLFVSNVEARAVAYYPVGANTLLTMNEAETAITPTLLQTNDMGNLSNYSIGGGLGVQFGDEVVKISPYETDYLVGCSKATTTSAQPTVELVMKHALAMVAVRITKHKSYYGRGEFTSFTVSNHPGGTKPLKKGAIRLHDNQFIPSTQEISYSRTFSHYAVEENADYNDRVGFLAFPAIIPAGALALTLIIDGKQYSSATNAEAVTFEPGKLTRLTITVKASEIILDSSILVEDWIDTDEKEFEVE